MSRTEMRGENTGQLLVSKTARVKDAWPQERP